MYLIEIVMRVSTPFYGFKRDTYSTPIAAREGSRKRNSRMIRNPYVAGAFGSDRHSQVYDHRIICIAPSPFHTTTFTLIVVALGTSASLSSHCHAYDSPLFHQVDLKITSRSQSGINSQSITRTCKGDGLALIGPPDSLHHPSNFPKHQTTSATSSSTKG